MEKKLFNTDNAKSIIRSFRLEMKTIKTSIEFENERNKLVLLVTQSMENTPAQWDLACQININWFGDQFLHDLSITSVEFSKENLDMICAYCFRFLFELYLSIKTDLATEFENAKRFVFNKIDQFDLKAKDQIEFAIRDMPINIFKMVANSEAIDSIKNLDILKSKLDKYRIEWEAELKEKEKRVNELKIALDKYETAFNFVGLYEGFDKLASEKNIEKESVLIWMKWLSFIIVLPIIIELLVFYYHIDNLTLIKDGMLIATIPTISLVLISIYYFRVLLFNYKSVKSQLLQIELRKTLCRFIQSYSKYASELKVKDKDSLSKFENIIFSGIIMDESKLPSAYDGIEQVGNLIKDLKG